MKRVAFGSFVPGKKRKTSALPEDDIAKAVPDEEAAVDEEAEAEEDVQGEAVQSEEVQDDDIQDEEAQGEGLQDHEVQDVEMQDEDAAVNGGEPVEDEAAQDEDAQDGEDAVPDEEAKKDGQVAGEEDVVQGEDEDVVADDDGALEEAEEEAAAEEGADVEVPDEDAKEDDGAAPEEGETELYDAPDAEDAEMEELANMGQEMELAKQAVAPDSHLDDDDDAPAPNYLQDQPDSDSSDSDSSGSSSASSRKAVAAISDTSSLLDLLGSASNPPAADAAKLPEAQDEVQDEDVQDEEAPGEELQDHEVQDDEMQDEEVQDEEVSAAEHLEWKLTKDLAKLGPKKKAARLAQLSTWLWDRLRASTLPSGLGEAHEVEALILRLAGEPEQDVPQPSTPPRKVKRKTGGVAQRQRAEPSHREPLSEPLWPILSGHPQHHGFWITFAKKKALCEIAPIENFREEDLWFHNPGQAVCCEWCDSEVPQAFGALQGAEGRSTFSQCEFVCFTCIGHYGCGE